MFCGFYFLSGEADWLCSGAALPPDQKTQNMERTRPTGLSRNRKELIFQELIEGTEERGAFAPGTEERAPGAVDVPVRQPKSMIVSLCETQSGQARKRDVSSPGPTPSSVPVSRANIHVLLFKQMQTGHNESSFGFRVKPQACSFNVLRLLFLRRRSRLA